MQTMSLMPASARLEQRVARPRRRDEDHGHVGADVRDGLVDAVEDGHARDRLAAVPRRDAGDDVGPGGEHAPGVERALAAGDALDEDARGVVDEDGHQASPPGAAAAARSRSAMSTTSAHGLVRVEREGHVGKGGGLDHRVALLGGVAVEADDDRRVDAGGLDRLDEALGDVLAAGDAAEDVDEHGGHRRPGEHGLEGRLRDLGAGAAADVAEVGGLAAGSGDLVDGAHHQAGAVADDADVAVQRDEREARRAGLGLAFVLRRVRHDVRLPEEGVVVDGHLAVQADDLAARGEHQRVHLDQSAVALPVERPQRAADRRQRLAGPGAARVVGPERRRVHDVAHLVLEQPQQRVDGAAQECAGVALGELLDVHAAAAREDQQRAADLARDGDRQVELARDVDGPLHQQRLDGVAADGHGQDVRGRGLDLGGAAADADAARLAAAAGLGLRLDADVRAELFGRAPRLGRSPSRRATAARAGRPRRRASFLRVRAGPCARQSSRSSSRERWPASRRPRRPDAVRGRTPAR